MEAGNLVKEARRAAGVSQAELARRLGTTQSAVARLEKPGSNPRVETVDRALRALGRRLEISAPEFTPSFDSTLLERQLRKSPAERLSELGTASRSLTRMRAAAAGTGRG